ncbi:prolipoprotein diacylglyceryl transferase family protein [Hyalangium gracile]|uniref:prolipoprotein diacylglyceryl transferase family protein n=1 Tax=Hyalangium gracile TaxID=394092 RepID=UPI001CC8FA65|nr:prolipoprotein diacylglyceryl transferase family protein [Hyalangium gracile]
MAGESLNRFLDSLPRTRFGRGSTEVPVHRTCGIVGYYVAVITTLGAGLIAGRSLLVLAVLSGVCALSFFIYTWLRRAITGHEELVLLEHVWFALACATGTLLLLGESVVAYLDAVAVGLAFFLTGGRVGCLFVGCCHGKPSALGIRYPESCASDGFPRYLVGIRLFPVQAIEAVGLTIIGLVGLVALPFEPAPGRVLVWFLMGYAVMRFGLEGLRGDKRPHLLGLSQARWMSLVEVTLAVVLIERARPGFPDVRDLAMLGFLAALMVASLALRHALEPRRHLLAPAHLEEVRSATTACLEEAVPDAPGSKRTSRGVTVVASPAPGAPGAAHVSLSLSLERPRVELLCELAATAFPKLDPGMARLTQDSILYLALPPPAAIEALPPVAWTELYGNVVRQLQAPEEPAPEAPARMPMPTRAGRQSYFSSSSR